MQLFVGQTSSFVDPQAPLSFEHCSSKLVLGRVALWPVFTCVNTLAQDRWRLVGHRLYSILLTPYNTLDVTSSRGLSRMSSLLVTFVCVCSGLMRGSWARLTLEFALCRLLLRLAQSLHLDFATLAVLAGDLVIERPATELAEICRQLLYLWRQACDESSHTCLPRVILAPDLPAAVTVWLDGRSMTLPNIHRQLLLLTHLQPGRQHGGAWGAPADCGGGVTCVP